MPSSNSNWDQAIVVSYSLEETKSEEEKVRDGCKKYRLVMNKGILIGYIPGAIGRIAELHATYYHRYWGFGLFFEAKVAMELSEFLRRFDERCDGFWTVCLNDRVEGSIAIDGIKAPTDGAHLRWFIVSPEMQGRGLGSQLMGEAISFCKKKNYRRVYLWTFEGLHAARHLYEKFGFKLVEQNEGTQWGKKVIEQKFELQKFQLTL